MKKILLVLCLMATLLFSEVSFYEKYNISEQEIDNIIQEAVIKTDKQLFGKISKYKKDIEKLIHQLETLINQEPLSPKHDNVLNKLTKLSNILDKIE